MKKTWTLPMQILLALVLGIAAGLVCGLAGLGDFTVNYLKPFGDIFVNLLKFIVVPVVLFSMIGGKPLRQRRPVSQPGRRCPVRRI